MKNKILWFCRIFVGVLFIFSGLVKANDPVGFGIKLNEYYEVFADTWSWTAFFFKSAWLMQSVTWQAAFLTTLEVALGIALLMGIRKNFVSWMLLLLILFFTWLTGFTAVTGTPKDCGCFGDAIPLTALQSFYKDIVLTILIVIIFFLRKNIKPAFAPFANACIFLLVTGFAVWVNIRVIRHDVFIDFRPYAKGKNITEQMAIPDDAEKGLIEMNYIYLNKETGKEESVAIMSDKPDYSKLGNYADTTKWKFVNREDNVIEEAFIPEISDFNVSDESGNNLTEQILQEPDYQFMIVSEHFDKTSAEGWKKIKELEAAAEKEGLFTFALVGEGYNEIEKFRHENQLAFPFYPGDAKVCVTIARVNPSVILLKQGTIVDKWSWRDLPAYDEIKGQYFSDRKPKIKKPKTDELFSADENVLDPIKNSIAPYNEFFMQDINGADASQTLITDSSVAYMMIINELGIDKLTMDKWNATLEIMKMLDAAHVNYFVVSSGDPKVLTAMRTASKLNYNYYVSDKDVLLKIIKENAGLVIIKNGVVMQKFSEASWPADNQFITN